MQLEPYHIELLRELAERSRVQPDPQPDGCEELEASGYIKTTAVNSSEVLTEITSKGRAALVNATGAPRG